MVVLLFSLFIAACLPIFYIGGLVAWLFILEKTGD